jgi:hypothetical protein
VLDELMQHEKPCARRCAWVCLLLLLHGMMEEMDTQEAPQAKSSMIDAKKRFADGATRRR